MWQKLKIKSISLINGLQELIFPSHCYVCGEKLTDDYKEFICSRCLYSMPSSEESEQIINDLAQIHGFDNLHFLNAYCLFKSTDEMPFEKLIYSLKYKGVTKIGEFLGKMLGELIRQKSDVIYDYVIPVPIHKAKERERTYNQSHFIAKAVAEVINSKFEPKLVIRKIYTDTQTKLSAKDRLFNVKHIFEVIDKSLLKNTTILIVDDVLTTGSTVNSLAETLLEADARRIDVATLMRA
jgi:ComF family protein